MSDMSINDLEQYYADLFPEKYHSKNFHLEDQNPINKWIYLESIGKKLTS